MTDTAESLELFRQQTAQWLEENCPASMRSPATSSEMVWSGKNVSFASSDHQQWFERMRDKGWFTPDWPAAFGGGGLSRKQNKILQKEMAKLKCRQPQINLGIWMLGPVLLEFGKPELMAQHLPNMTAGKIRWCQGFSEPNAGSDLASLQMKAETDSRDEDYYVINGSKIWTSYADESDAIYTLVKTSQGEQKHDGITFLLIDMELPGITISPIELISGKSNFCQVFFDNVRVPKSQVVGEEGQGWKVAKRLMQHERVAMANLAGEGQCNLSLAKTAKEYYGVSQGPFGEQIANQVARQKVAHIEMDERIYQMTMQRVMEEAKAGGDVGPTSSIFKYYMTEIEKRKTENLLASAGTQGLSWGKDASFTEDEQTIASSWLMAKVMSIGGGTSEIQLNVIAKRVLGLPTE